jgi:hypothetical protein
MFSGSCSSCVCCCFRKSNFIFSQPGKLLLLLLFQHAPHWTHGNEMQSILAIKINALNKQTDETLANLKWITHMKFIVIFFYQLQ